MASVDTSATRVHRTLVADTEDVVQFADNFDQVEVVNHDTADPIYFTVDGDAPTVEGDSCHVVPPGGFVTAGAAGTGLTKVRLISEGSTAYSVGGAVSERGPATAGAGGGGVAGDASAANQDEQTAELVAIKGHVDTLEALIASTNTKLDTLNAKPGTVLFAEIDRATSGAVVAAAGSGNKIRVLSYALVVASAVTVEWRSASTGISGAMSFPANGGINSGYSPVGHFETAANEALNIQLGSGVQVSGHLAYVIAT